MREPQMTGKKSWQHAVDEAALISFFRDTPLLKEVPSEELTALSAGSKVKYCAKGSVIFRFDEPSNWMYFVYSGHVAEFVGHGSSVDIIVKTRRPHDYIGEMGMLVDAPYPNTAVAMENLILIVLPKETFLSLADRYPSVLRYIIRQLIDRLTNSARKLINAMYLDAPGRLAFTLVALSGDMSHGHDISVTQSDLAASAGIARQTVAKILGEWRRENWISTVRGRISIDNLDALLEVICSSELR